jgi:hypothetical protein
MRILFFTWRWALRRFEDVIAELAGDGHEVVIVSRRGDKRPLPKVLREYPLVTRAVYDEVSDPEFGRAIAVLRHLRDYAWYLSPEQEVASFNRRRALDSLLRSATGGTGESDPSWPDPVLAFEPEQQAALSDALGELDSRIPPDPGVVEFIRAHQPDVVLVSPLVHQRFHQNEVVKAARALGIPSGFLVYSWDNLSNKGRIHVPPDRIFVWNKLQRQEAVELHGIDPGSVVVTGASRWDEFFAMQPSKDREQFCAKHGFDPARPIVVYLGSTVSVCPNEPEVLDHWIDTIRAAPAPLGEANILFRRHPGIRKYAKIWGDWVPKHERVSTSRSSRQADQTLYDELYHAAAVIGLNTSAQIEAAILGRPVYTFSAGAQAPGQMGSRHFYYLLEQHGGIVSYAETMDEHVGQIQQGLADDYDREALRRFCVDFVRPFGLDRPVSPILAEEVLKLADLSREETATGGTAKRMQSRLFGLGARPVAAARSDSGA